MGTSRSILLKKWIRHDWLWTRPSLYNSTFKHIPLFLDTWALMKSQFWSRIKLEKYRERKLALLFKEAARVQFWEDRFQNIDFSRCKNMHEKLLCLPVSSKHDFMEHEVDYNMRMDLVPFSDADHTSGSTGKPFPFRQDWGASLRSCAITERIFRTATGKRYPIVYMRARQRNGFTFYKHVWFFSRGYSSVAHRIRDLENLAKTLPEGFVLYGYTSWVLEVARQMEKLQLEFPLKAVMVAGEHISAEDAKFIERVMKAELFTFYASRETGFLAYECPQHNLHIAEEWAYLEVVDDAGKPLPYGQEGRILVTTFDNRIMPFIRYEIGDRGVISDVPCPCGRTLRTITFRGRTAELIELEGGRTVSLLDLAATIDWYWNTVRQFQIVQKSKSHFHMKVVPGPIYDQARKDLEDTLHRFLQANVQITWEVVNAIPEAKSGKAVYYVRDF
jgi:phenylacetate-CoA ligase